ncbi:MAG: hypothetical protein ABIN91_01620 [Mucilaginibacter sp.]|uniref:hypothetical protein n=1 Tax=Mucilaginibacter sp. TaxID=1882438 RepID=UPI00326558E2
MSKRHCLLLMLFLLSQEIASGQSIERLKVYIGQKATEIQTIVGNEVQTHYNAKDWLTKTRAQIKHANGCVSEVILYKENVLIPEFQKSANYCVHYIIKGDTLSHIATEYLNLNMKEVRSFFSTAHVTRVRDYYFFTSYQNYFFLYLTDKGTIVEDFRKTILAELPPNIQEEIIMLNKKFE